MSDTAVVSVSNTPGPGRKTLYREEYCDHVIEWGRQGKSKTWMVAELGICKRTMQLWEQAHPEFLAALTRAKALEQQWWEDAGQAALSTREFQSSVWSRSMAARFPDDWREKLAHVGGNKDDEPIKQEVNLGADAFTRAIAGIAARSGEGSAPGSSE